MSHYTILYADHDGDGATEIKRRRAGPALATATDARGAGKANIVVLDHSGNPISLEALAARVAEEKDQ